MATKSTITPRIIQQEDPYVVIQTDVQLQNINLAELFSLASTVVQFLERNKLIKSDKKLLNIVNIVTKKGLKNVDLSSLTSEAKLIEKESEESGDEHVFDVQNLKAYLKAFDAIYTVSDNEVVQRAANILTLFVSFFPTKFEKAKNLQEAYQKIDSRLK